MYHLDHFWSQRECGPPVYSVERAPAYRLQLGLFKSYPGVISLVSSAFLEVPLRYFIKLACGLCSLLAVIDEARKAGPM
jgi:hypothetical protein